MNEYIEYNNGKYKFWDGKRWQYGIKTRCENCGEEIFCRNANYKKTNKGFCSRKCQNKYHLNIKDPKAANILNNKNNDFYYLIGLICTDGSIRYREANIRTSTNYSCTIQLQYKDKELLENIKYKFGGQLYYYKKRNNVIWRISNRQFIEYLRDIVGLTHNKSLTLDVSKWFCNLSNEQQKHFMRGVFDGDGGIRKYKAKNSKNAYNWCSSITSGSKQFIELVKNYFPDGKLYQYNNCFEYTFHGSNCLKLCNNIYENIENNLYMERKFNIINELRNYFKDDERSNNEKK